MDSDVYHVFCTKLHFFHKKTKGKINNKVDQSNDIINQHGNGDETKIHIWNTAEENDSKIMQYTYMHKPFVAEQCLS
jgi:hypothetical protein